MKNKIKKTATYSSLKNDINDILRLMIDYKNDQEMLDWCRMRLQFNIDRMLYILKNGDD